MITALLCAHLLVAKYENPNQQFPSLSGASGLLRSISALPNKPTTFGASFIANFFGQTPFINDPVTGQALKTSRNQFRLSGHYSFDVGIPLEVFGGTTISYSDNSSATRASTVTTFFENTDVGARVALPFFSNIFNVGTFGFVRVFSGTRASRNTSTVVMPPKGGPWIGGQWGVNESLDFGAISRSFPLRQHLQVAYRTANGSIADANQQFNRFALDVYTYRSLVGTIALEFPTRYVNPIVEYSLEYNLEKNAENVKFNDNRQKATFGARITPFPSFGILALVDRGVHGPPQGKVIGIPRNPTWDFYAGLTFQAVGESLLGLVGSLRGMVTNEKGEPLANVRVSVVEDSLPVQDTTESGGFDFPRLRNGSYTLRAEKEGYDTQMRTIVIRDGSDSVADITLPLSGPKMGSLDITVSEMGTQSPLRGVTLNIAGMPTAFATDEGGKVSLPSIVEGPKEITATLEGYNAASTTVNISPNTTTVQAMQLEKRVIPTGLCHGFIKNGDGSPLTAVLTSDQPDIPPLGTDPLSGEFSRSLPVGTYTFQVQAENYLPQTVTCTVVDGMANDLNIVLEKPKEATIIGNKIVLPEAIFFDFGKASLKKESYSVLNQVVDVLNKNPDFGLLKIEGHTDDIGSEEANQKLSEARARSVRRYLGIKGISLKKLQAIGFGESQAIATNLTPEGRAENRRVEFNLVRD